jgi:hypothetical protein
MSSEGIDISTGFQTNIGVQKSFYYKLDAPYSSCVKNVRSADSYDSKFYRAIFNVLNMTIYRQIMCNRLCLQEYILDKCSCLDASLPSIYDSESTRVCMNIDTLECISKRRIDYFESEVSKCEALCPLECDQVKYKLTLSNSRYPTTFNIDYMKKHTKLLEKLNSSNDDNIPKSTLILNVFYEDLDFVEVKEVPSVKTDELVSNVGGKHSSNHKIIFE